MTAHVTLNNTIPDGILVLLKSCRCRVDVILGRLALVHLTVRLQFHCWYTHNGQSRTAHKSAANGVALS